jgi:hypothetical protein
VYVAAAQLELIRYRQRPEAVTDHLAIKRTAPGRPEVGQEGDAFLAEAVTK